MSTLTHNESSVPTLDPNSPLKALLVSAATYSLSATGWIAVLGEDRDRWLNGMLTNNIRDLKPGEGCYNFLLSAQGRIQHDATAFQRENQVLLETARDRVPALIAALDHFIIMDDVELQDISNDTHGIGIAGPDAAAKLAAIGIDVSGLSPLGAQTTTFNGARLHLVAQYSPLVPRYELWADNIQPLAEALSSLPEADEAALEALRILEGTPTLGKDIRDKELPQETGQTRALHFSKGCYLGQEIVERIRSRGNVHRTFAGFRFTGQVPAPGTAIHSSVTAIGELTSIDATLNIALGFIRREALERGQPLSYDGGELKAETLPFRI